MSEISKKFTKQTQKRNATLVIKILTNNIENAILPLNKEALNHLKLKHPEAKEASAEVLFDDVTDQVDSIKSEAIKEQSER